MIIGNIFVLVKLIFWFVAFSLFNFLLVYWPSLLHKFIQHSLDSRSARLNSAGGASQIRDGEDLWQWSRLEIKLWWSVNSFVINK